jgi:hypothetical protein
VKNFSGCPFLKSIGKQRESEVAMKYFALLALTVLGSIPAMAQDQASCKAYFQVMQAVAGTPGLPAGLDSSQKTWWENTGKKKYPGMCLDGSVMAADKPRFLVIWSKSKTMGQSSLPANEVYGQTPSALQNTAVTTKIYQPRWDQASITVVNVQYDGSLMLPPVYFGTDDRVWILAPSSRKVLEGVLQYLWQERVFLTKPD